MTSYGIFVVGPSGSGKTTFCNAMHQFFTAIQRKHIMINLDPANDNVSYEVDINIKELIQIEEVMNELNLGPNGGLVYCFDFLEKNIDWLLKKLALKKDYYMVFDLPGQIELYMDNTSLKNILQKIQNNNVLSISLTSVSLFDCLCCYDPYHYISTTILSLISQINLETPHVNVIINLIFLNRSGFLQNRSP